MHNRNVSMATTLATSTTHAAATTSILTEICELEELKNTMVKLTNRILATVRNRMLMTIARKL